MLPIKHRPTMTSTCENYKLILSQEMKDLICSPPTENGQEISYKAAKAVTVVGLTSLLELEKAETNRPQIKEGYDRLIESVWHKEINSWELVSQHCYETISEWHCIMLLNKREIDGEVVCDFILYTDRSRLKNLALAKIVGTATAGAVLGGFIANSVAGIGSYGIATASSLFGLACCGITAMVVPPSVESSVTKNNVMASFIRFLIQRKIAGLVDNEVYLYNKK